MVASIEVNEPCGVTVTMRERERGSGRKRGRSRGRAGEEEEVDDDRLHFSELSAETLRWLQHLSVAHGHVVLRGVCIVPGVGEQMDEGTVVSDSEIESAREAVASAAGLMGEVLEWGFGKVLTVRPAVDGATTVTAFEPVILHFDGVFWKVPSWQFFLCVTPPPVSAGAHTLFIHTAPLVAALRIEAPDVYAWAACTTVAYFTPRHTYFGGSWMEFPLLAPHPHCADVEVLLAHEFIETPQALQPVEMKVVASPTRHYSADQDLYMLRALNSFVTDPRFTRHHVWRRGDIVLADNLGQLHGRSTFAAKVDRLLLRAHIGHPTEEEGASGAVAKKGRVEEV